MTTRAISRTGAKWIMPRYKREWQNICALLPAYLDDGTNGTVVTYLDGSAEAVAYRLCWVVDDLLLHLHTSREVLTKRSRMYLGKNARRVPLIASSQLCLVPVKGREAVGEHDSTVGYIVFRHVQKIMPAYGGTEVHFSGEGTIQVLDRPQTLWANIQTAEKVKD